MQVIQSKDSSNQMQDYDLLITDINIASMAQDNLDYGIIKNGSIAIKGDRISWIGSSDEIPKAVYKEKLAMPGKWITPALIDCHTHLVFAGNRAWEFEERIKGKSYSEISLAGGGIISTVLETRKCSKDKLINLAKKRLKSLQSEGVGTIEIKSGYGLDLESEKKMLMVANELDNEQITIKKTFLGAHSLPPEYKGRGDDYIKYICNEMLPEINNAGLIDAVDAFCETIAFSNQQISSLFDKAVSLNLPVKLHADQLSNSGGAELAAEYNALSADHIEYTSNNGVKALANAGCVAVLLPGAFMTINETQKPPINELRKCDVPMAIATDCNPGSSPICSIRFAMTLAANLFQLTPEECLAGVTREAAKALGIENKKGTLEIGKDADIAIWDINHPNELTYWVGFNQLSNLIIKGKVI